MKALKSFEIPVTISQSTERIIPSRFMFSSEGLDWINQAQNRDEAVGYLKFSKLSSCCVRSQEYLEYTNVPSFFRRIVFHRVGYEGLYMWGLFWM